MQDDPYSLSDLCRMADVTPRTVRYYVAQGLLRSPDAAGPATRYSEGHLARLRLIKRLQREHQPLAGIRSRLEQLDDADIASLLGDVTAMERSAPPQPEDTLEFIRGLMAKSVGRTYAPAALAAPPPPAQPAPSAPRPAHRLALPVNRQDASYSLLPRVDFASAREVPVFSADAVVDPVRVSERLPSPSSQTSSSSTPDRSTWERLAISPDVEIHVRRPLDRLAIKRVDQLVRFARELFDREP